MATAWSSHPADYPLAYRIANRLWGLGDDRLEEMLGWARMAVALRPNSPFAHNMLGHAWRGMHKWDEAEASIRHAIELSRNYPKDAGAQVNLGNVKLEKGDLAGAEVSYRAALAIDPNAAGSYFNMGLVHERRGELAGAEEWLQKAVALAPTNQHYREVLNVVRDRAKLARRDELAAGRANPATPAEAIELAEFMYQSPRRRYVFAVKLYSWAFAVDFAWADDIKKAHRYNAACLASMAAAGKDEEMTVFGTEEWGYLTGLALKWLQVDLAQRKTQAQEPNQLLELRDQLTHWKNDPDLATIRDPAWLAAMPPTDRKLWEAFWRDVDAALLSISKRAGTPTKP
jgi:tetratricopeptide (TPR) repeat protein